MTGIRCWTRFFASVLLALVAVVGFQWRSAWAGDAQEAGAAGGRQALAEWSRDLWSNAQSGRSGRTIDLLEALPREGTPGELHAAVGRYRVNLQRREGDRAQRMDEVRVELKESAEKSDLFKALKSAIELHTLSRDKSEVLAMPEVRDLVAKAEAEARKAESEGRWLDAHGLFNRLNLLYDEAGTYEADLRRLGQRLVMLRLYAPERLHEMRNTQRRAEGEEALPPFNKVGEDWREKLKDIDEGMVFRSVGSAAQMHVDRVPLNQILTGGYRSVRTMATTADLSAAFPALADAAERDEFVRFLDGRIQALQENAKAADHSEVVVGVRKLLAANANSVRIAPEALLHEFANGAIGELDDFSAVIWPDELAQFERTTEGTFKGVGIQITLNDALELKVVTPLEGTPAARAGIRAGDLIRRIDADSTLGMSLTQAVDRITGKEGTKVILSVEREGAEAPIDYELVRAEIPIFSVKGWLRTGAKETDWDWYIDRANRIGYLRLSQFTNKTTQEMRGAVDQMTAGGLRALILDLRGNPGGLLSEAVGVSSLFVSSGVVVTQEDNQGHERERQTAAGGQARLGDLPVVVLVNGGSASASEIVAGCLQDYKKAVIVGDRSFGKGSVQNVFALGAKAAFKLTTQYYRLPGRDGKPGRLIHKRPKAAIWGIEPDVQVEMLPKQFGEAIQLRQEADIVDFDAQGRLLPRADRPDPSRLLTEGMDPQLETALLLLQTQVVSNTAGVRAAKN